MKYLLIFTLLPGFVLFSSCDDGHGHDENDGTTPVFNISLPTANQVYKAGDTIHIKGVLTDNELHELQIDILRNSDSSVLFHDAISLHSLSSYNIQKFWVASAADTTTATVVLKAWDHKPNIAVKRIPIRIDP